MTDHSTSSTRIGPRDTRHWNIVAMSRSSFVNRVVPALIIFGIVCALACIPVVAAQAAQETTVNLHAESTMIPAWVAFSLMFTACLLTATVVWFLAQLTGGVNVRLVTIESEVKHMRQDLDALKHERHERQAS